MKPSTILLIGGNTLLLLAFISGIAGHNYETWLVGSIILNFLSLAESVKERRTK